MIMQKLSNYLYIILNETPINRDGGVAEWSKALKANSILLTFDFFESIFSNFWIYKCKLPISAKFSDLRTLSTINFMF